MAMKLFKKTNYDIIENINDQKINVLVLGTSGCGKSTLINSILQEELAQVGVGRPITKHMSVYENDTLPFRMIDSVGYEYGYMKQLEIKQELKTWAKNSIKNTDVSKLFHVIWFCIDGTVKRINDEVLDYLRNVSRMWKDIPIIVVFTKSYSQKDEEENVKMFKDVMSTYKHKDELNIKNIIPVVSKAFEITDTMIVPSKNLDLLISTTNILVPEAKRINRLSTKRIDINMKRTMAYSLIGASTSAATVVGAIPITIPDATILVPLQVAMLKGVANIYGIKDEDMVNDITSAITKVGATTMIGRNLITLVGSIPGLTIGTSLLNASIAGLITAIAGEVSLILFEKVYKGELDVSKVDITHKVTELFEQLLPGFIASMKEFIKSEDGKTFIKNIKSVLFKDKNKPAM